MKPSLLPRVTFVALTLLAGCQRVPQLETRTFPLDHLDPGQAGALIEPYVYTDRAAQPGMKSATESAITVRETADNLDKIERVLAEYDKPLPNLRLHFRLIEADGYKDSDPRIAEVEGELRKIFQFGGYRLAGEAYVSATDRSEIRPGLVGGANSYSVNAMVYWAHPQVIRLQEVSLLSKSGAALLSTTVNIRPGQTLVLGTSPGEAGSGSTLLLAVTADSVTS